ncbi:hypothetical protein [Ascidiimonas sp. W6]|uniref:hypothetical protein n=1 Tax=Ascidiimonas meishanensis TaxID=3128903 RepID=UPI0030EF3067
MSIFLLTTGCQSDTTDLTNNDPQVTTQSIDDQINKAIASLDKSNVVLINLTGVSVNTVIKDGFEYGFTMAAPGDIVCRGSGLSFAKYVRNSLDGGIMLLLYVADNGDYVAAEA